MRQRVLLILGFLGGCSFDGSVGSTPEPDARVDAAIDAPPDMPMNDCPSGYEAVPGAPLGSRYYKLPDWVPLGTHAAKCAGEHVVVLDSDAESLALRNYTTRRGGFFWVGISDEATEGTWVTATGKTASYLPWAPGQPDGGDAHDCAVQNEAGLFFDVACNVSYPTVCECD
jgi:Lectin C-type domain